MDSWRFSDGGGAGCSTRTLDSFGGSFCSTSSDDVLNSDKFGGWSYFDSSDSDPLSYSDAPPVHEQIYQSAALMECRGVLEFGMASRSNSVTTDDQILLHQALLKQPQMAELFPENPSLPPQIQVAQPPPRATVAPTSQHRGAQFPPPDSDEAAVMRAMMVVISSAASSSSSVSSPPVTSNPPQELWIPRHAQASANALTSAFRTYTSGLFTLEPEPKGNSCSGGGGGQRMIKKLILVARRIRSANSGGAEGDGATDRATNNQRHHMISERMRREKLNDSFHRLRMILPPTLKKDKASVLIHARNYLKTLRAQITDLEEKNQRLETHLHEEEAREGSGSDSSGSVQVQVTQACESASSELQQINMRITVRVECDIVDLVLNVLECLKGMKAVSVESVDAYAYSPNIHLFARANIRLQIKMCDWNEAVFHETMNKAVDSVVLSPESIFQA